ILTMLIESPMLVVGVTQSVCGRPDGGAAGSGKVSANMTMTEVERLARFVTRASYDDVSDAARGALKAHLLDALGCAIGALDGEPIGLLRAHIDTFGGRPLATLIGGGKTAPDRAALYNGALVRYLDFNDSFLAPGETCHPSDNLGAVLSASEHAQQSG